MSVSAPPSCLVEAIWLSERPRPGPSPSGADRRRPSPGISAVLLALRDGPAYGAGIARRVGQDQGNVARWLAKLRQWGFVNPPRARPEMGNQGGGRPALVYELSRLGRTLADALADERRAR